jgi:hypothetical protein
VRAELERLIAEGSDSDEIANEAGDILVELIRLEGRARRLLELGRARNMADAGATDFAGLSLHEAARRVLEEEGRPLHARELGTKIKAHGWRHPRTSTPRPDQIVFQLAARLPKHPDVFRRVAPNTFALAAWEKGQGRDRPKPSLGLFRSGGRVTAASIGEHPEAPVEAEEAAWRSS